MDMSGKYVFIEKNLCEVNESVYIFGLLTQLHKRVQVMPPKFQKPTFFNTCALSKNIKFICKSFRNIAKLRLVDILFYTYMYAAQTTIHFFFGNVHI